MVRTKILNSVPDKAARIAMLEIRGQHIPDYFVAFVRTTGSGKEEDAAIAGSGTLVSIGDRKGILTAAHVIEKLPSPNVGLIAQGRGAPFPYQFNVRTDLLKSVRIPGRTHDGPEGPDLGFVELPLPTVGTIEAKKSFYNLDKWRDHWLANPKVPPGDFAMISGAAEVWSTDDSPSGGFRRVKQFRGLYGEGVIGEHRLEGENDYLDFEVEYGEDSDGPDQYQGLSGGGLWHLPEDQSATAVLAGVAFYELPGSKGKGIIKCHGPLSVFQSLVNLVLETV
jgi:hypothetical protein